MSEDEVESIASMVSVGDDIDDLINEIGMQSDNDGDDAAAAHHSRKGGSLSPGRTVTFDAKPPQVRMVERVPIDMVDELFYTEAEIDQFDRDSQAEEEAEFRAQNPGRAGAGGGGGSGGAGGRGRKVGS